VKTWSVADDTKQQEMVGEKVPFDMIEHEEVD